MPDKKMSDKTQFFQQNFLSIVIFLQVVLYASFFLNMPIVREVVGIAYLTFIPGIIFVKLLKLDDGRLSLVELILYSVGFSISFLMLAGLLIDQFGLMVGFDFPLSTLPLSLYINTIVLIGAAIVQVRQEKTKQPFVLKEKIPYSALIFIFLPILSVFGTYLVNVSGNNSLLMIMFVAVTLVFIAFALINKQNIHRYYPFVIFMIALALLFQFSLISNYILPYGGDSPVELFVARYTQINSVWYPVLPFSSDQNLGRINAMLSVTVLPTIYSNMIGMDPTWVFKIIYPLIFAFIPLALYVIWQPYVGKKFAFLAVFLFMAQATFYTEMLALNRQIIAELFFVLLLAVILNNKMKLQTKFISFAFFAAGLIFSHYALAIIFLFMAAAVWIITYAQKRSSYNLQFGMILLFFVGMFGWYLFTSGAIVYDSFVTFSGYITSQLGDFLNPASRGQTVLTGLGLAQSPSLINTISRVFAYLTEIFIVIGIVAFLAKKTKFNFDREYTNFAIIAIAMLAALTIVPGLANTLDMTRFYHILLIFLAPFCIIGMWTLVKAASKYEKVLAVSLLVIIIIVPYFLFQTNFIYEVAQTESWSVPLSGYRMDPLMLYGDFGYIDTYSVYGAEWASINTNYQNNIVADNALYTALTGYGLIWRGYVTELTNTTVLPPGQYVYLSYISINYAQEYENGTIPAIVSHTNVIYSNGGCEIRYVPGS